MGLLRAWKQLDHGCLFGDKFVDSGGGDALCSHLQVMVKLVASADLGGVGRTLCIQMWFGVGHRRVVKETPVCRLFKATLNASVSAKISRLEDCGQMWFGVIATVKCSKKHLL